MPVSNSIPYPAPVGNPPSTGDPTSSAPPRRAGKVCGAKKRDGTPCQARPYPNGRCRVHGGCTPGGIASPHYKTGKYSRYLKHLPHDLKAGYRKALADRELTSLHAELALLTIRADALLDQLSAIEAPPWAKVVDVLVSYERARRSGDKAEQDHCFTELAGLIRTGSSAAAAQQAIWQELRDIVQERTRTSAAEHKRQIAMGAMMEVSQVMLFIDAWLAAAREVITDRDMLRRVSERTLALLPRE
jgi:hypothetical protein